MPSSPVAPVRLRVRGLSCATGRGCVSVFARPDGNALTAATTEAQLYAGASGFSYPSWKDGFYPPEARPDEFLHIYGERLPSVELNTTFYRLPAEGQFERWAAQTPPGFRFAVTMSRGTTAFGRVRGLDAAAKTISALGDRLGPVRIKVPQARDDGFLRLLLDSLDPALSWALDFRHQSWSDPHVQQALDERGVARVDSLAGEAPFRYIRLREPPYDEPALSSIANDLSPLLDDGVDVYAYFRHEDEPRAPRYAERLLELAGRSRTR
jgi:uncharacterized protein YecE (DUF72 family)